jgi:Domain of unknown function (DUF1707)/Cell wall-active antibiotics response 4TMS YvqF
MDDASIRVSDADRDSAVAALREHLVAGRLTLEEFSARVEAALQASVGGDLARLQQDLPAAAPESGLARRKPTRVTAALFGHVVRRGRLRLHRWTFGASACGDLDLDLREAVIDQPRTAVNLLVACGNVDVYVPEGVTVAVSGITAFGHLRERGQDIAAADAPTIHVRAVGCFATVDVWRVPHDAQGSYADIIRQTRARERQLPA